MIIFHQAINVIHTRLYSSTISICLGNKSDGIKRRFPIDHHVISANRRPVGNLSNGQLTNMRDECTAIYVLHCGLDHKQAKNRDWFTDRFPSQLSTDSGRKAANTIVTCTFTGDIFEFQGKTVCPSVWKSKQGDFLYAHKPTHM